MSRQSYILTLYLPNIERDWEQVHDDLWATGRILYVGSQLERCPTTQRLHWQAFVKFNAQSKQRGTWFKTNVHPSVHFQVVGKEYAEAICYGTKAETRVAGPKENGIRPVPIGKKAPTNWEEVKDNIIGDKREDVPFDLVLRFQLERRWDGIRSFYQKDERASLPGWLPNPWFKVFSTRIKDKKRHWWIFSREPNLGKTYHFAKPIAKEFRVAIVAGDITYFNFSGKEEGVIFDDYNSQLFTWTKLNQICDGTFAYRRIYNSSIVLRDPLIVILSNKPIYEIYPSDNEFVYARFNEREIKLEDD